MTTSQTGLGGLNRVVSIHRATSPSLRDVQQRIASLILDPTAASEIDGLFALPAGVAVAERLNVYSGGYPARLHEALVDAFPAVEHVIGHSAFHALTARYLKQQPPLYYNLNDAGAGMPRFLRSDPLTTDLPFLPDLAELEWSLVEVSHAREQSRLDVARLSSIADWDRVILRFRPEVRVVVSSWPIREIWEARETSLESIDIELANRPDRVLVYRDGYDVRCESIDAGEAVALGILQRGGPLGEIALELAAKGHDTAAVSSWFARWMELGLITDLTASQQLAEEHRTP